MSLKDNLRTLRERAGYTQAKDFAENVLKMSYSTYMGYETRGTWPSEETLTKIAVALNVTMDELLGYRVNELDAGINKIRELLDLSVKIDGEKIIISEKKMGTAHPVLPPAIFTKQDFIDFMRGVEARTKEYYDQNFADKLFDYLQMAMLLSSQTENYNDFIARLSPYNTTSERSASNE